MRDAGVEVLEETRHERRPLALIRLDKVVAQQGRERRRGRLVTGAGPARDLRPLRLGRLAPEVSAPARAAPPAQGPWAARPHHPRGRATPARVPSSLL